MAVPAEVRVFGKRYAVKMRERGVGGSRHIGESDHIALSIEMDGSQAADQLRDTLLHEVMHAIDYGLHAGLEEHQVHAFATGLFSVMRDNPGLVEYLMAEGDG